MYMYVYNVAHSHYEDGGSSTIALQSLNVSMSEILTLVIRKRRLHIDGEKERGGGEGENKTMTWSLLHRVRT